MHQHHLGSVPCGGDGGTDTRKTATDNAKRRGERLIEEAKERADGILRTAREQIEQERRQAESELKQQIVEVSHALSEKLLSRELNEDDHRAAIDAFLDEIGEEQ